MNKLLTVANVVTFIRAIIGVFFLHYLYVKKVIIGAVLYIIFVVLDGVDGYVARKFNQETLFGKNFDVITDAVVGIALAIFFIFSGVVPISYWYFVSLPLVVYVFALLKGLIKNKNSIQLPQWKVYNAAFFYITLFLFIINSGFSITAAYVLVPYLYVASVKYLIEVNKG